MSLDTLDKTAKVVSEFIARITSDWEENYAWTIKGTY